MTEIVWNTAAGGDQGAAAARTLFTQVFGGDPVGVWSAPGRVNVIGEHVDYNGGPCLPIALPHRAYVAVRPREDRIVRLVSPQTVDAVDVVDLDEVAPRGQAGEVRTWAAYLVGVAWALEQAGHGPLGGFDVALWNCVPQGGGLSSSAALECSMAVALDELFDLGLAGTAQAPDDQGRKVLVDACRRAENEIAGANTGGLDQTASLRCAAGHALALDCRDMSTEQIPFDLARDHLELLVIDTRAPHSLNDGQYASRRADCEAAAAVLGVDLLVEVEDLDAALAKVEDPRQVMRVRHVVSEVARTRAFIDLLRQGPLEGERLAVAGALLDDSHDSLRDDYQVTCRELDLAVDVARAHGAHGARMTGGGFGGSAIALVDQGQGAEVAARVAEAFALARLNEPHFMIAVPGGPAGREQ
ncbi:galactokinase [Schaalia sp. 19OD2882]|uniref:galactokinase n=1 Tax=Schaalia sp. 19OD2882 TaxID=2794089 RepID=UPI001C1EBA48|nr:galactokinase [Schaalia sp. 19OD2882]QWW19154.1 galactokinase [Schaalia sp. 19OD2882]